MARRRGGGGWSGAADVWQSLVRLGVGAYWLYFASQKWPAPFGLPPHGIGWMHKLLVDSAQTNPVPGLGALLTQLVLPNWQLFATAQAVAETTVAVLLIIGLATRPAALLATPLGPAGSLGPDAQVPLRLLLVNNGLAPLLATVPLLALRLGVDRRSAVVRTALLANVAVLVFFSAIEVTYPVLEHVARVNADVLLLPEVNYGGALL